MDDYIHELRTTAEKAEKFFANRLAFSLGPVELKEKMTQQKLTEAHEKVVLIDVRAKEDYDAGHIAGAISIPKKELKGKIGELSRNDIHIIYCYNPYCHLGSKACLVLAREGFPVMELCGGYDAWANYFRFDIEK